MRVHPEVFLVCYDISHPARLRRVHRTVRAFGDAVQLSVFVCALTPMQRARLEAQLKAEIHHDEDQVLFVPLGMAGARTTWRAWSLGRPVAEPDRVVRIF